jgi:transcriptional regulator of acetoin/glycerol metabolism
VACHSDTLDERDFAFLRHSMDRHTFALPGSLNLREVEKQVVLAALERTQGNMKRAAEILGIDRSTLYERLKRYGIPRAGE